MALIYLKHFRAHSSSRVQRSSDPSNRAHYQPLYLPATCCAPSAGELEASLSDYNRVLMLEPSSVDALYYRGSVYEKLGQLDAAIGDFSAVLALDPNHIKVGAAGMWGCVEGWSPVAQIVGAPGTYSRLIW